MHKLLSYLKHLLTATNQHGVHSPFIYNYLTQCLYSKPKYKVPKSENVVLKSIPYFSIEKFKMIPKDSQIENRIQMEFGLKASNEAPFDFIYLDSPAIDILSAHKYEMHNDSIILVKNIHRTKDATRNWEALKQDEIITVSMDMFCCGVLFFRKEQAKEHFKIRI